MSVLRFIFVVVFSLPAWLIVAVIVEDLAGAASGDIALLTGLLLIPVLAGLGVNIGLLYKARSAKPPVGSRILFWLGVAATFFPVLAYPAYMALLEYGRR